MKTFHTLASSQCLLWNNYSHSQSRWHVLFFVHKNSFWQPKLPLPPPPKLHRSPVLATWLLFINVWFDISRSMKMHFIFFSFIFSKICFATKIWSVQLLHFWKPVDYSHWDSSRIYQSFTYSVTTPSSPAVSPAFNFSNFFSISALVMTFCSAFSQNLTLILDLALVSAC